MRLNVDASFENGVFVPRTRPALADREHVRLTIERDSRQLEPSEARRALGSRTDRDFAVVLDFHPDGC
jgi:Protein of unknown function DUF104